MIAIRRIWLFLRIVGNKWDVMPDGSIYRIGIRTAWKVARIIHP